MSIDILAVADTKAEFGLQLRLRERGASSQDGNGRKWGTKKAQESTSAGAIVVTFTDSSFHLPQASNTVYTVPVFCCQPGEILARELPAWLVVSSTWVFLGLERNRYAVSAAGTRGD